MSNLPEPDPFIPEVPELTLDEVLKFPVEFQSHLYVCPVSPEEARQQNETALIQTGNAKLWKEYLTQVAKLNDELTQHLAQEQRKQQLRQLNPSENDVESFYDHLSTQLSPTDILVSKAPSEMLYGHLRAVLINRALTLLHHANQATHNGTPDARTLDQEHLALKIFDQLQSPEKAPKQNKHHSFSNTIQDIPPSYFSAKLL